VELYGRAWYLLLSVVLVKLSLAEGYGVPICNIDLVLTDGILRRLVTYIGPRHRTNDPAGEDKRPYTPPQSRVENQNSSKQAGVRMVALITALTGPGCGDWGFRRLEASEWTI
jgi:hypothetical protein